MLTIAHLSDLHFGDACARALEAARAALVSLAPDCIVITGDVTQAGRRREFVEAAAWISSLPAASVVCAGNHDAPVYALLDRVWRPFSRFKRMGLADRWIDPAGRAAVVSWNSARAVQARLDWSQGVHDPAELEDALEAAAIAAPEGWRVLACHHPPGAPHDAPIKVRTSHARNTRRRLGGCARTILLCGHVHQYSVEAIGETLIVTAPTLASSRERGRGRGFVALRLDGAGAQVERVPL